MTLLWTSHCCFQIFFLVSSLICIEFLRLSGQILFLGTFLSRIYSRSIPAFLCTGMQSTPVAALLIQRQIKHYTFLLVGSEWQFENFTYKTETVAHDPKYFLMLLPSRKCSSRPYSGLSLWIQPTSEPWQLFPGGKRNEVDWLKCLLATLKPDSEL